MMENHGEINTVERNVLFVGREAASIDCCCSY